MSCECCWRDYQARQFASPSSHASYSEVVAEHESQGCPCSRDDAVGKRRRAGQFWDEELGVDVRGQAPR